MALLLRRPGIGMGRNSDAVLFRVCSAFFRAR
jgi:hypothetical protein